MTDKDDKKFERFEKELNSFEKEKLDGPKARSNATDAELKGTNSTVEDALTNVEKEDNAHSNVRKWFRWIAFVLCIIIMGGFLFVDGMNIIHIYKQMSITPEFHMNNYDILYRVGVLSANGAVIGYLSKLILETKDN